jgi:hypothetical protein
VLIWLGEAEYDTDCLENEASSTPLMARYFRYAVGKYMVRDGSEFQIFRLRLHVAPSSKLVESGLYKKQLPQSRRRCCGSKSVSASILHDHPTTPGLRRGLPVVQPPLYAIQHVPQNPLQAESKQMHHCVQGPLQWLPHSKRGLRLFWL